MRPLLALLGLLLLVAAVLYATDVLRPGRDAGEAPAAARASSAPAPAPESPPADLVAAPDRPEEAPTSTRAALPEEERFGEWDASAGEAWLAGSVAFPPGAPPDTELLVLALSEPVKPRELYGRKGLVARLLDEQRDDLPKALLARGRVEPDGTFRVPFPGDRPTGVLVVAGRYLYTREPAPFDVRTDAAIQLLPSLGALITGRLELPPGVDREAVLDDVAVILQPDQEQFSMIGADGSWLFPRDALVQDDGTFEVRAIDADRPYQLTVRSEETAPQVVGDLKLEPGAEKHLDVRLSIGATVRGRVADESDAPVEGAQVTALKGTVFGFPGAQLAQTKTDAQGLFELPHVPPGRALLVARSEGYLESSPEKVSLEDEGLQEGVALVLEDGASIQGIVRNPDRTPAPGVEVQVQFDPAAMVGMNALNGARGARGKAETDEGGRFQVTGLGKGPFVVSSESKVPGGDEPTRAQHSGVPPGTDDLELVLQPLPGVHGRVVDLAGEPIARFEVAAQQAGAIFFAQGESKEETFEGADGAFELTGLEAGTWSFTAKAEGYGRSEAVEAHLPEDQGTPIELVLAPAASVAGRVLDSFGEPVEGAKVTLGVEATQNIAVLRGDVELPATTSAADGSFLLEGLSAGDLLLVASHPQHAESERKSLTVAPGELVEGVVLELRVGGRITGVVYDKDGDFLSGAQVIVQQPQTFQVVMRRTDENGAFEADRLTPGTWSVTAMLGEGVMEAADDGGEPDLSSMMENMRFTTATVTDGEEVHVELGAPPANPVVVSGRITHAGEPAPGKMVSFIPEGGGMDRMKFTQTSAEGTYRVELAEPGSYLVQVQSMKSGSTFEQQSVEFSESIPEAETYSLDLALPVARISGRVLSPEGDPLAGARVTLTTDRGMAYGTIMGGNYAESTTDADGRYEFGYLRPGQYAVAAGGALLGGAMGMRSEHGRQVRSGLSVEEGGHLDRVDFRLERAGEIDGMVRDTAGLPVAGATVFVRDEKGQLLERFSMQTSGEDGKFRCTGIAPGRYTVLARTEDRVSPGSVPVDVRSDRTAEVEVTLDVGTVLYVSVVDEVGTDLRASIRIEDSKGHSFGGMVSYADLLKSFGQGFSSKEQRFGPLPPDRYVVTAVTDDGREERKPLNLTGQAERRLKIRLR